MVKVLVVEDEASIREMIALNLRLAGMEAVEADSAEAALPLLEQRPGCDAAILDVMLPGMNGFSLCETIRRTDQKIGIIILSAKGQEQDKIRGLSIGADDYMTKPFSLMVLRARIEKLLQKGKREKEGRKLWRFGELELDFENMRFLKAGVSVELSKTEQRLLKLLVENHNITMKRETLLSRVWTDGAEYVDENALSVTVKRLRDKLEDKDTKYIHTVYGIGYVWEER